MTSVLIAKKNTCEQPNVWQHIFKTCCRWYAALLQALELATDPCITEAISPLDKACSQTLLPDLQFLLQVMRRTHEWDAQRQPFGLGLILRTTTLALLFLLARDYAALFTTLFGREYIQSSVLPIAIPIVSFAVGPMWHLLDFPITVLSSWLRQSYHAYQPLVRKFSVQDGSVHDIWMLSFTWTKSEQ